MVNCLISKMCNTTNPDCIMKSRGEHINKQSAVIVVAMKCLLCWIWLPMSWLHCYGFWDNGKKLIRNDNVATKFWIQANFASVWFLRIWCDSMHVYIVHKHLMALSHLECTAHTTHSYKICKKAYRLWLYAFAIGFQCRLSTGCAFLRLAQLTGKSVMND